MQKLVEEKTMAEWERLERNPGQQKMTKAEFEELKKREHQRWLTVGALKALKQIGKKTYRGAKKAVKKYGPVVKEVSKRAYQAGQYPSTQFGGMFEE